MKNDSLDLSTDLLRISNWIIRGQDALADTFIDRILKLHKKPESDFRNELTIIKTRSLGREKSAEKALTLSRILFFAGTEPEPEGARNLG